MTEKFSEIFSKSLLLISKQDLNLENHFENLKVLSNQKEEDFYEEWKYYEKDILLSMQISLNTEKENSLGFLQKNIYSFVENILEFDINMSGNILFIIWLLILRKSSFKQKSHFIYF